MQLKIEVIGDGTGPGTRVMNADTGEPIEGVGRIEIVVDANHPEDNKFIIQVHPFMYNLALKTENPEIWNKQ